MSKARKEKLSIYLAKEGCSDEGDLLKIEDAKEPIALEVGGSQVTLYVKRETPKPPPTWTKLFSSAFDLPPNIFGSTQTVGAAAIFRHGNRTYILTFGSGYHLLRTESVERDFGLRVTLSSVDPDKLRSVDKASYDDNPLNSRTQSSTEVDIFELQMDSELEMLYAVTGVSRVPIFGSHVTGRDALTIAVDTNLAGIPSILDEAFKRYTGALPPEFEWVDNIRRVKDSGVIAVLDSCLDDELSAQRDALLWLGEPEIVDWESQVGYSFDMYSNTPRHVVLRIEELAAYLQAHKRKMDVDTLKSQLIHVNNSEYESTRSWTAYRCLYVELALGEERYMLRNGLWFQAEPDFVALIDTYIKDIEKYSLQLPPYAVDREDLYNEALANSDAAFSLMDKKNTKLGGRYDKIEFCDLVRNGTDLIHVKYYRSSGTLSHLFAQGFVAAEAFVKDEEFRFKLNEKLPASIKLKDPKVRPEAGGYTVVYAIATTKTLPTDLPFFSKVTLRNAMKTLRALGYNVQLAAIDVDPSVVAKKKCKPKSAPKH